MVLGKTAVLLELTIEKIEPAACFALEFQKDRCVETKVARSHLLEWVVFDKQNGVQLMLHFQKQLFYGVTVSFTCA